MWSYQRVGVRERLTGIAFVLLCLTRTILGFTGTQDLRIRARFTRWAGNVTAAACWHCQARRGVWLLMSDWAFVTPSFGTAQVPSQALLMSLADLPSCFLQSSPDCQHLGWAVDLNYLKDTCWHFTSNHFNHCSSSWGKCFVAMATQTEDYEVKYSGFFISRALGVDLPAALQE